MSSFTLTPIEAACGVTIEAVTATRARSMVHMTPDGFRVIVDAEAGPALASAAARMALGTEVIRLGRNALGFGVYGVAPGAGIAGIEA